MASAAHARHLGPTAGVAKSVDAGDLKSPGSNPMRVRVPPPALIGAGGAWIVTRATRSRDGARGGAPSASIPRQVSRPVGNIRFEPALPGRPAGSEPWCGSTRPTEREEGLQEGEEPGGRRPPGYCPQAPSTLERMARVRFAQNPKERASPATHGLPPQIRRKDRASDGAPRPWTCRKSSGRTEPGSGLVPGGGTIFGVPTTLRSTLPTMIPSNHGTPTAPTSMDRAGI